MYSNSNRVDDGTGRLVVGPSDGGPFQQHVNRNAPVQAPGYQPRPIEYINVSYAAGTPIAVLDAVYVMPEPGQKFIIPPEHADLLDRTLGTTGRIVRKNRVVQQPFQVPAGFKLVPVTEESTPAEAVKLANPVAIVPQRVVANHEQKLAGRKNPNTPATVVAPAPAQTTPVVAEPAIEFGSEFIGDDIPDEFIEELNAEAQADELDDILKDLE